MNRGRERQSHFTIHYTVKGHEYKQDRRKELDLALGSLARAGGFNLSSHGMG